MRELNPHYSVVLGKHPMNSEENGYWTINIAEAHAGDEYLFHLFTPNEEFKRIDPYAREVTSSVGNAIVHAADLERNHDFPRP